MTLVMSLSVCRRLSASSIACAGRKCEHCFHCEIAAQLSDSAFAVPVSHHLTVEI